MLLFEIAFVILSLLAPAMCVYCYRLGLLDNQKIKKDEPVMQVRKARAEVLESEYTKLLDNINNYSGDGAGQKDI